MLCQRLLKMYNLAMKIADNESHDKKYRREGTAEALRLKKPNTANVEDYYPLFMDMVKNLLDGTLLYILILSRTLIKRGQGVNFLPPLRIYVDKKLSCVVFWTPDLKVGRVL